MSFRALMVAQLHQIKVCVFYANVRLRAFSAQIWIKHSHICLYTWHNRAVHACCSKTTRIGRCCSDIARLKWSCDFRHIKIDRRADVNKNKSKCFLNTFLKYNIIMLQKLLWNFISLENSETNFAWSAYSEYVDINMIPYALLQHF